MTEASLIKTFNKLSSIMNETGERSDLLSTVDGRLSPKLSPDSVVVEANHIIGSQYMNLHRLPEDLSKVQLVPEQISNELLNQHVVELPGNDLVAPPVVGTQYYDDDLLPQDLTEEDKRLAAALVAVQFVQQQKQQHSILGAELLVPKVAPLSPISSVSIEKPAMAAMVTSYIHAFEEDPLLDPAVDRGKLFQTSVGTSPLQELRLPPLPPLKRVLTSQNMLRRHYERPLSEGVTLSVESAEIEDVKEPNNFLVKSTRLERNVDGIGESEEVESDYEGDQELKPCRKSLPHKKRIPRKLKAQPSRTNHSKAYKCYKCGSTFNTQQMLNVHKATHLLPLKKTHFSCEICNGQFHNQIKFFEHLKAHYEPQLSQSINLNQTSQELVQVSPNLHITPVIQDAFSIIKPENIEQLNNFQEEGILRCNQCNRTFKRQKAFETHLAMAHAQMDEFSEPEDMMEGIRHVVSIQASAPDEEQDEKMRNWRYNDDLSIPSEISLDADKIEISEPAEALDSKETGKGKKRRNKASQCPHCGRVFTHRNSLLYHIRSHTGRRPHQCEVCGKGFFAANALRVHMRMHSGDKPYKCEICSRSFRQWGDLKYHMTSLHSTQKQYQCEFCGKDFARKYSLIVHRRIHTGEKNYVCEFCRKTFRASSYLVNHRRIHTGEKPYTCDVCHKPFRVKSDMKRHRNTHNKERLQEQDPIATDVMVNMSEGESILPDRSPPLNLNIRQDSTETLTYSRVPLDRDPNNTMYVWLPVTTGDSILSDE